MDIQKIGVIGAGTMGQGITQVAATTGFSVLMNDITDELAEKGKSAILRNLEKLVKRGKIDGSEI